MLRAIGIQTLGTTFSALVGFALLTFLGRVMGPASFGGYVSLLSAAVIALIVIEGGWPTLLYRESVPSEAQGDERPLLRHGVAHVVASSLVLAALAWIGFGAIGAALSVALLFMGCIALTNLVSARLRGRGLFAQEALWQGAARVVSALAVVLIAVWVAAEASLVFLAWGGGLLLAIAVWGWRWLAWPTWRGIGASYRRVLPFVAGAGLMMFLLRADMAVLAAVGLAAEPLSHYAVCTRFTEAAVLLFAPVTNVLLRSLRLELSAPARFEQVWTRAVALAIAGGAAAILGAWLLGEPLVSAVFGAAYRPAGALLPFVAAALPFALSNLVLGQALVAQGRERQLAWRLALSCGLLVVALWLGVRWDGARGAAIGTALVQALLLVLAGRAALRVPREVVCASP